MKMNLFYNKITQAYRTSTYNIEKVLTFMELDGNCRNQKTKYEDFQLHCLEVSS